MKDFFKKVKTVVLIVASAVFFILSCNDLYAGEYVGAVLFIVLAFCFFPTVASVIWALVFAKRKPQTGVVNSLRGSVPHYAQPDFPERKEKPAKRKKPMTKQKTKKK